VTALCRELPWLAERVRRLDNRALFEIPQILAGILHQRDRSRERAAAANDAHADVAQAS
jgi:hypothetical protein